MGLFDDFLGGDIRKHIICEENPMPRWQREFAKETARKHRRKIEEVADNINPVLGKIVKTSNNINDTLENAQDSLENGIYRTLFSAEVKDLKLADHLYAQRFGYTHHGLYIGNGMVIHYLAEQVQKDTLETFAAGAKIHKKTESESPITYSRQAAVNRAYERLYEDRYNLIINNCDSFVRWCRNGASS